MLRKSYSMFFSIDISFHECILYTSQLSRSMIWTVRCVCPPAPIFELRFISDVELKKNTFSQCNIPKSKSHEMHMIFSIFRLLITYTKDIHTRTMWTQIICCEIPLKIQEFMLQQTTRDLVSSISVFFYLQIGHDTLLIMSVRSGWKGSRSLDHP